MALTARQQEIFADIETGIKFLRQQYPERVKFEVKEIMVAAGQEDSLSLYRLIKILRKNGETQHLHKMRSLFRMASVTLEPLEKWYQSEGSGTPAEVIESADIDELALKEKELFGEALELEQSVPANTPLSTREMMKEWDASTAPVESRVAVLPAYVSEIDSLSQILRIMAPMSRPTREFVHESIGSFFKIGY